jgi:diguanylate cyclase (GGDEF)-like protein
MLLDIPTVLLTIAFMQILCGLALIGAYFFYKDEEAAIWWGAGQIILAAGVLVSVTGGITGEDWITATSFILFLACAAVQWHGTRLLTRARPYLPLVFVGPILMAAINLVPVGEALPMVRGMTAGVLNISYFGGALYVLLRPPSDRLTAYKPLALLFVLNIVAIGLAPFGGLGSSEAGLPELLSLAGLINIMGQIFVIGTTIFVIVALRERKEVAERKAAALDSLTGLSNRGSFLAESTRLVSRCTIDGTPFSVVVVDLDRFKQVNDNFGHAAGDAVLRVFAEVARKTLRVNDKIGRLGGEEFALFLYGSGAEAAMVIAERLRRTFQDAAEFLDGQPVRATLSAGVATSIADADLETLLREADAALYQAKDNGRNRVECISGSQPPEPSRITRVA